MYGEHMDIDIFTILESYFKRIRLVFFKYLEAIFLVINTFLKRKTFVFGILNQLKQEWFVVYWFLAIHDT